MRIKSIATHLRPYVMLARRRTTINHAFAAAVAPSDTYDEVVVAEAMRMLGFDPADDLPCAYCGVLAETWDHVHATVKGSHFSGYGHRLGNLLPCCKTCNSKKGNKSWQAYLAEVPMDQAARDARATRIANYLESYARVNVRSSEDEDFKQLEQIRTEVLRLLNEGDRVAARIRAREARAEMRCT